MPLAVDAYDEEERKAIGRLGYTEYAAFGTKTFDDVRFPVRMTDESQIFRYVDWYNLQDRQRLEPGQFYREASLETNYSMDEIALLTKLANASGAITEKLCGRKIKVHFNHQGSVGLFRATHAISRLSEKYPLSVFEVGPGCGYTGAMIGLAGHRYAAYDVAQGYYIWQSRLHEHLFRDEFTEFVANPEADLADSTRVIHFPWWRFLNFYRDCPVKADVVISNANLGEMSPDCLRYVLRVARRMMEGSEVALFIFANYGAQHMSNQNSIRREFELARYELVCSEKVFAFCPKGHGVAAGLVAALEEGIPLYHQSPIGLQAGGEKTFAIRDFVDFEDGALGDEYYFNAFINDWPDIKYEK
jgi:hypothetical protein